MGGRNWYEIDDLDELDSPALVVYPERVRDNIRALKSMVDDISRLRPHIKTNKSPQACSLMIEEGITKFKCATIAEAEMLGQCGAEDVLLAYQPTGPKLKRFISVIENFPGTKYSTLFDNPEAAIQISEAALSKNVVIELYLDLNIGMNRTGIIPGEAAFLLYKSCAGYKGVKVVGLHAYDGHVRNPDLSTRIADCEKAFDKIQSFASRVVAKGLHEPIIVAGGSPTFPIHAKRKKVECSPGTFIYWDKGYADLCKDQPFKCAALLVARVISLPDATKVCLDLGHKSVAAENDLQRRVSFLNAEYLKVIGQSEEHLVVDAVNGHYFSVGEVFYGVPYHICPTVALYEKAITVEDHKVTGEWRNLARDRKITY